MSNGFIPPSPDDLISSDEGYGPRRFIPPPPDSGISERPKDIFKRNMATFADPDMPVFGKSAVEQHAPPQQPAPAPRPDATVGDYLQAVNRGLVSIADAPIDLANFVGGKVGAQGHMQNFSDRLNDTPFDLRSRGAISPNGEFAIEAAAGFVPSLYALPTQMTQGFASLMDAFGVGHKVGPVVEGGRALAQERLGYVPEPEPPRSDFSQQTINNRGVDTPVTQAMEIYQGRGPADQMPGVETPRTPVRGLLETVAQVAQRGDAPPVAPVRVDEDAALLLNRLAPEADVNMIKNSTPQTRARMAEMLASARGINDNSLLAFQALPRDIVGTQIAQRATALGDLLNTYGRQLDEQARALGNVTFDSGDLVNGFLDNLRSARVRINDGVLDLTGSDFERVGALHEPLQAIYDRITGYGGSVGGYELHRDKQWITNFANYTSPEYGTNARFNDIITTLRREMNDILRAENPDYALANDRYSAAVEPFREIAVLSGDPLADFTDPQVIQEIARKSRGLTNNTAQGVRLNHALRQIDEQLLSGLDAVDDPDAFVEHFGLPISRSHLGDVDFDTDLVAQAQFASVLDNLYPNLRPTSLQGIIESASRSTGEAVADAGLNLMTGNYLEAARRGLGHFRSDASTLRRADALAKATRELELRRRESTVAALERLLNRQ